MSRCIIIFRPSMNLSFDLELFFSPISTLLFPLILSFSTLMSWERLLRLKKKRNQRSLTYWIFGFLILLSLFHDQTRGKPAKLVPMNLQKFLFYYQYLMLVKIMFFFSYYVFFLIKYVLVVQQYNHFIIHFWQNL